MQLDGKDMELWPFYDSITCDTLSIRGALSDLFPRAVHEQWPAAANAPGLGQPDQVALVRSYPCGD